MAERVDRGSDADCERSGQWPGRWPGRV